MLHGQINVYHATNWTTIVVSWMWTSPWFSYTTTCMQYIRLRWRVALEGLEFFLILKFLFLVLEIII
jgi:hypothetical protein